jgi:hypothetical protein
MFGHTDDISFQKFFHCIHEILMGRGWRGSMTYIRMCSPELRLMLPFTAKWHIGSMGYFSTPLHRVPVFACMASCIIRHRDKHLFVNEINIKIHLENTW